MSLSGRGEAMYLRTDRHCLTVRPNICCSPVAQALNVQGRPIFARTVLPQSCDTFDFDARSVM